MSPAGTPHSLGAVIRARRHELGWTQEELAERVIVQGDDAFRQSDVSRLERGKVGLPHRDRLGHIAAVLGLSPGELLARSGWAGADRVATMAGPMAPSNTPEVAAVATSSYAVPAVVPPLPGCTPVTLPRSEELSRLREALAQARAIRATSRSILDKCEATRALYVRSLPSRDQR